MLKTFALLAAVLIACSNDGNPVADAPSGAHDAPRMVDAPGSGMHPEAGAMACTGALYDGCTGNTGCMSGNCKLFSGSSLQVCTQACSASNPCPAQNGVAVTCNNMGICKPAAANACTPM